MKGIKLQDICDFEKGATGLAKAVPGEYPLVATGVKRRTCKSFQFDAKAVCIPLVSSTGHGHASLKNVHYQEGKFALGTILVALTAKDSNELNIQFLHLYLSQLKDIILVPLMSGAANVALSVTKIKNIEIPLPSIERQTEIVTQFQSIMQEEIELKTELTHQQTLLKKLRQQILQEAIEGKLTEEFRIRNDELREEKLRILNDELRHATDAETIRNLKLKIRNCSSGETAVELLHHIQAEKAQLTCPSGRRVKDKKIKKQKPLPPISEDEKPFELPAGWVWCRLGDITINSLGKMLDAQKNKGELKPYLRNLNIQWFNVNTADLKLMPFEKHETEKYSVIKGDIVICEGGYPGQAAIWNKNEAIMFQKAIHRVRFIKGCFPSNLFVRLLWLWDSNNEIKKYLTGAGIQHLTGKQLNLMLIPLPPLLEQKAIVTKVEKLLALCDQLESKITRNQSHAEQLMQAVLKEAFQLIEN